jgi:hypothetical protein
MNWLSLLEIIPETIDPHSGKLTPPCFAIKGF